MDCWRKSWIINMMQERLDEDCNDYIKFKDPLSRQGTICQAGYRCCYEAKAENFTTKLILNGKRLAIEDISMFSQFFLILYFSMFYTFNQLIIVIFWTVTWIVM